MDGEVRSALTYPSLLRCSALRPTADVKVRAQLAPGEPLCTREWGICSHLEQAGKSGQIHSWLHQAEPAHQTNQWQHQEIPCLVQIPSWVLWRGPHMASTPKNELAPPISPRFDNAGPKQSFWFCGQPCSAGSWQGRRPGDVGCSLPGHQVTSPGTWLPTSALRHEPQLSAVPGFTCGYAGLNQALNVIWAWICLVSCPPPPFFFVV